MLSAYIHIYGFLNLTETLREDNSSFLVFLRETLKLENSQNVFELCGHQAVILFPRIPWSILHIGFSSKLTRTLKIIHFLFDFRMRHQNVYI